MSDEKKCAIGTCYDYPSMTGRHTCDEHFAEFAAQVGLGLGFKDWLAQKNAEKKCEISGCRDPLWAPRAMTCEQHYQEFSKRPDFTVGIEAWVARRNVNANAVESGAKHVPAIGSRWTNHMAGRDGVFVVETVWLSGDVTLCCVSKPGHQWTTSAKGWPGEWKPAPDLKSIHGAIKEQIAGLESGGLIVDAAPQFRARNQGDLLAADDEKLSKATLGGPLSFELPPVPKLPALPQLVSDFTTAMARVLAEGPIALPTIESVAKAAALAEIVKMKSSFGNQKQLAGMGIPVETWILSEIDIHPRDAEALGVGTLHASGYRFDPCRGSVGLWVFGSGSETPEAAWTRPPDPRAAAVAAVEKAVRECPADLNPIAYRAAMLAECESYPDIYSHPEAVERFNAALAGVTEHLDWNGARTAYDQALAALSAPCLGRPVRWSGGVDKGAAPAKTGQLKAWSR